MVNSRWAAQLLLVALCVLVVVLDTATAETTRLPLERAFTIQHMKMLRSMLRTGSHSSQAATPHMERARHWDVDEEAEPQPPAPQENPLEEAGGESPQRFTQVHSSVAQTVKEQTRTRSSLALDTGPDDIEEGPQYMLPLPKVEYAKSQRITSDSDVNPYSPKAKEVEEDKKEVQEAQR